MQTAFGGQGLRVISVHSPEFDYEKERAVVERAVKRFELEQPVYLDNDYRFWKGLGNNYWPAFYLVDRAGNVRYREDGEMHSGTTRAKHFEQIARELLAEPRP